MAMRFARLRPALTSSRRRRGKHGQGLVEFGLVAPIFFFTIFAMVDGGFLMFSINAVDQATTIATNSIASLGKVATADITSMQRMAASAGLETTSLITISEIDVEGLAANASQDGFALNSDGTPQILTGCSGGPNGGQCINQYQFSGSGSTPTIVVLNSPNYTSQCLSGDASGCPPWPPAVRNVFNGQSSFAALKVTYTYRFLTGIATPALMTTTKTFRLEPQLAPGP
jgi:Flp pilus assembly protein TadG